MRWLEKIYNKVVDFGLDWLEEILKGIKEFSAMNPVACIILLDVMRGVLNV